MKRNGADDVYEKPKRRDDDGFAVLDRNRRIEPQGRFHSDRQGNDAQNERAGKSREIVELARAEGKAPVARMPSRHPISPRGKAERADMGRHVHAVCQQCHGAEHKPGDDLDGHEGRSEVDDETGACFRTSVACAQIDVIVGPGVIVRFAHLNIRVSHEEI